MPRPTVAPPAARRLLLLGAAACLFLLAGCSTVKRAAVGSLADALSSGGNSYATDEDPELIRQAIPFSLKLMESTLEQTPEHRGLLLACCSGFTQYGYAFVVQEADETEARDFGSAEQQRVRARKLFLRARRYGLRGLELSAPGIGAQLARDPVAAVGRLKREDVPLLYWTAAAWGALAPTGMVHERVSFSPTVK